MSVDGTWKITIQTPMGAQESTIELVSDGSALTGTQSGNGESGPIYGGSAEIQRNIIARRLLDLGADR